MHSTESIDNDVRTIYLGGKLCLVIQPACLVRYRWPSPSECRRGVMRVVLMPQRFVMYGRFAVHVTHTYVSFLWYRSIEVFLIFLIPGFF